MADCKGKLPHLRSSKFILQNRPRIIRFRALFRALKRKRENVSTRGKTQRNGYYARFFTGI